MMMVVTMVELLMVTYEDEDGRDGDNDNYNDISDSNNDAYQLSLFP